MELGYTPEITAAMQVVTAKTKAIDDQVNQLDTVIRPLVAASEGEAFRTLQQAVATWRSGATDHTAVNTAFAAKSTDAYEQMMATDRQAAGFFQV